LLLSGTLTTSVLQGTLGSPATGAVFTTNVATVTGGSLAPFIVPGSLGLSMNLSNVNGGAGLSVGRGGLNAFQADSAISISGDPTPLGGNLPEPGTFVLTASALLVGVWVRHRAL